jgi:HlyD family secretion protein
MKNLSAKKVIYSILGLLFVILLFMGVKYLITSNSAEKEEFLTRKPMVQNMEDKVMATGKIVPREEIEIKPNMSGIIDKILVKEGDKVTAGQLIATLKIVPSVSQVNAAQQDVQNANLQINNAKLILLPNNSNLICNKDCTTKVLFQNKSFLQHSRVYSICKILLKTHINNFKRLKKIFKLPEQVLPMVYKI